MVILDRLVQSQNADSPIEVTPSGMVMLVRSEQFWNADSPIEVTLSGIVTLVRLEQDENAKSPIEVTGKPLYVLGISKDPLADTAQPVTLYAVPSTFKAKVRSFTEAAFKDATSKGNMSNLLNLIPTINEMIIL